MAAISHWLSCCHQMISFSPLESIIADAGAYPARLRYYRYAIEHGSESRLPQHLQTCMYCDSPPSTGLAVATDSLLHAILPRQSNLNSPCRSSRPVKKPVNRLNEISITNLLLQSARLGKLLCTFESVKPIPGAFATETLATCETPMPHRQKKEKPYH
jgi:hypothetical protein